MGQAASIIGVNGTIGAQRVGYQTFGRRSPEVESAIIMMRQRVEPVSVRDIADRLGVSVDCVMRVMKKNHLLGIRAKARKVVSIHKAETALEHVDDIRIMRGEDTESGEETYIVSVNDDSVMGHVCGTVPAAINDAMREWRKCAMK